MQKTPMNPIAQRTVQQPRSTATPRQNQMIEEGGQSVGASPALQLAERIRNEQGKERVQQFLLAMEPFLAPAERSHIAAKIGISLPQRQSMPPQQAQGGDSFSQIRQQFPGQSSPVQPNGDAMQMMQMMQMFSALSGMGQKGGAGSDPLALARLLGGAMGNKQK